MLRDVLETTASALDQAMTGHTFSLRAREVGVVSHVGGGIAEVRGLPHLTSEELVEFRDGQLGIAVNLEPDAIGREEMRLICAANWPEAMNWASGTWAMVEARAPARNWASRSLGTTAAGATR